MAELEAANKQLVDMLWGRRSERRAISPGQLSLDFGADPEEVPSDAEQAVIVAQQRADEAFDEQLLSRRRADQAGRCGAASSQGPGTWYSVSDPPDQWATAHPEAIRQGRVEEEQQVSETKRARRVRQRISARQLFRANS